MAERDIAEELKKRFRTRDRPGRKSKDFHSQEEYPPGIRYVNGRLPYGELPRLLEYAANHPGKWCRGNPMKSGKQAMQAASDIRRGYKPVWSRIILEEFGGFWQTEWGLNPDHNGIMQYYVWVRYERRLPNSKGKNRGRRKEDKDATSGSASKRSRRKRTSVPEEEA